MRGTTFAKHPVYTGSSNNSGTVFQFQKYEILRKLFNQDIGFFHSYLMVNVNLILTKIFKAASRLSNCFDSGNEKSGKLYFYICPWQFKNLYFGQGQGQITHMFATSRNDIKKRFFSWPINETLLWLSKRYLGFKRDYGLPGHCKFNHIFFMKLKILALKIKI